MIGNEIEILLAHKNYPSVSIIIPTDRLNAKKNHESLKKSVKQAKALLISKRLPDEVTDDLINKIEICGARMPETVSQGVGFYFSQSQSSVITFPFEVKHKIKVDHTFEHRDLLYLQQFTDPYYVINLSKKGIYLFKGVLTELEEIKNDRFPLFFEDQFEYQPAFVASSSSASLKGYENKKNQITEVGLRAAFRDADAFVKTVLSEDTKVLLAGSQRMTSLFLEVTTLGKNICGKLAGSYNENNIQKLSENAWSLYFRETKKEIARKIKDLKEKRNGYLAKGLQEAWTAASEGKGLMLVVEKDFRHRGFLKEGQNTILLQSPKKPYTIVPDAVDDLIETVRSSNGETLFTDDAQLKEFNHLALVLRY